MLGNHQRLLQITQIESLLSCNVEQNYQKLTAVDCSALRRPNLEPLRMLQSLLGLRRKLMTSQNMHAFAVSVCIRESQCLLLVPLMTLALRYGVN